MAEPKVDCSRVHLLIDQITKAQAEIGQIVEDARGLGFGTARMIAIIRAGNGFSLILKKLPKKVWTTLVDFVDCKDDAIAALTVAQLKLIVQVLQAQAHMLLESLEDNDDNKGRRDDLRKWLQKLNLALSGWNDGAAVADVVAKVKDLKTYLKGVLRDGKPWILVTLQDMFIAEVRKAIDEGLLDEEAPNQLQKTLIKKIAMKVVEAAFKKELKKQGLKVVGKYIDVGLLGWELLVEMAAGSAISDLQDYIDKLTVELVKLMVKCKFRWPGGGNTLRFPGDYAGYTVTSQPFIRCAKMVKGKLVWTECPVKYLNDDGTTADSRTVKWDATDQNPDGSYRIRNVRVDINSVNNSPCVNGALYCYYFDRVTFKTPGGAEIIRNYISGAKVFGK